MGLPLDEARRNALSASLARCLDEPDFLEGFYRRFLAASPEIAAKFRTTDFERQKQAMAQSLYVMIMATEQGDMTLVYLDRIAARHSRRDLDIPPEMYDTWLECLIETVRACDAEVTDELETVWRDAMADGIALMRARY